MNGHSLLSIKLPRRLDAAGVAYTLSRNKLSTIASSEATVIMDFSRTDFADPAGSLILLQWIDRAKRAGFKFIPEWGAYQEVSPRGVLSEIDQHSKFAYYTRFNGIRSAFDPGFARDFAEDEYTRNRYIPYQRLDLAECKAARLAGDDGKARRRSRDIADRLSRQVFGPTFSRALTEIIENVVFYAGDEAECHVMSQYRPLPEHQRRTAQGTRATHQLEVALVDNGCGLLETLRGLPNVCDDQSAIASAIQAGVSSTRRSDRGYGLTLLREATKLGGKMYVATRGVRDSGSLAIFSGVASTVEFVKYPLLGTLIGFSMLPELVNLDDIDLALKQAHAKRFGTIF